MAGASRPRSWACSTKQRTCAGGASYRTSTPTSVDDHLQSWSQGVGVWGESGKKKLGSAANIKVHGGGVSEATFLEDLSRMIGDYDRQSSSLSTGRGHRTVSQQLHRERIFDVADLASMP